MADRRRTRRKGEEAIQPSKEDYAVAKFLRFNVPVREGKLVGMPVKCFIASKAIDALLESKWSAKNAKKDPLFTTRKSCEVYCNNLLAMGLFHRAEKVERRKDREKSKKKKKEIEEESVDESKKSKKAKKDGGESEKEKIEEVDRKEEDKKEEKKEDKKEEKKEDKKEEKKEEKKDEEKKKKEKKVKLNMHEDQKFVDADDQFYVWIYDPVPFKTFMIGLLMVLGAIALCMFPLWPEFVRVGVYYISLAAAGFVGFILGLAVVRLILFCIIWCVTFGKHHFWFLPNLTEDVGILESFQPLYKHDVYSTDSKDAKKEDKSKSNSKDQSETTKKSDEESDNKSEQDEFEIVERTDIDDESQPTEADEQLETDDINEDETDEQNDSEANTDIQESKKDK